MRQQPGTIISDSTMIGRIYGQGEESECWFDLGVDSIGRSVIHVRAQPPPSEVFQMPHGSHLLVQLFEQPEVLWLVHTTKLNGQTPMMVFAPVEPLESADDRCEMPKLVDATLEQVDEAVHDAMDAHDRTWKKP